MGRICDAIDVLFNGLPAPIVREVQVPPANVEDVTLYRIGMRDGLYWVLRSGKDWPRGLFVSCADAFAAMDPEIAEGLSVTTVDAVRVGNRYFHRSPLFLHKPKIAKGKRAK